MQLFVVSFPATICHGSGRLIFSAQPQSVMSPAHCRPLIPPGRPAAVSGLGAEAEDLPAGWVVGAPAPSKTIAYRWSPPGGGAWVTELSHSTEHLRRPQHTKGNPPSHSGGRHDQIPEEKYNCLHY